MRPQFAFKANPSGGRMRVIQVRRLAVKSSPPVLFLESPLRDSDVSLAGGFAFFQRIHGVSPDFSIGAIPAPRNEDNRHHLQVVHFGVCWIWEAAMDRFPVTAGTAPGLTTTEAPFIEEAKRDGRLYITQPYDLYSAENHEAWSKLYSRMLPRWERYANEHFLQGIGSLCLDPNRVPRMDDVNKFLRPLTGFQAKAVSGYIPSFLFFDCLRNREFPTTITIRRSDKLDYLPEPDIFHDIAGHVPMHTDKHFAEALVRFGECAHTAVEIASGIRDREERVHALTSMIRAMARFFWFTIEFGLMASSD